MSSNDNSVIPLFCAESMIFWTSFSMTRILPSVLSTRLPIASTRIFTPFRERVCAAHRLNSSALLLSISETTPAEIAASYITFLRRSTLSSQRTKQANSGILRNMFVYSSSRVGVSGDLVEKSAVFFKTTRRREERNGGVAIHSYNFSESGAFPAQSRE